MRRTIDLSAGENICRCEQRDSDKGYIYVYSWDCGCEEVKSPYGDEVRLCPRHKSLPLKIYKFTEPVRLTADGRATTARHGEISEVVMTSETSRKLRRRVEDALRKGGTGQMLRCAEILGVRII